MKIRNRAVITLSIVGIAVLAPISVQAGNQTNTVQLKEGPVPCLGPDMARKPRDLKLVRIWRSDSSKQEYLEDFAKRRFSDANPIQVDIPGTPYSLLVAGGRIRPIILHEGTLWEIKGLGSFFEESSGILVGEHDITVRNWNSVRDVEFDWTLDLSNPKKGLVVNYSEIGGW